MGFKNIARAFPSRRGRQQGKSQQDELDNSRHSCEHNVASVKSSSSHQENPSSLSSGSSSHPRPSRSLALRRAQQDRFEKLMDGADCLVELNEAFPSTDSTEKFPRKMFHLR